MLLNTQNSKTIKQLLIYSLIIGGFSIYAQDPNPYWEVCSFEINEVDSFPLVEFEEILSNLIDEVVDSCNYSDSIFNSKDKIHVYVGFVLHRSGYFKGFTIMRGHSNELNEEVVRVFKQITRNKKFNPALKSGMKVSVNFRVKVTFTKNKI